MQYGLQYSTDGGTYWDNEIYAEDYRTLIDLIVKFYRYENQSNAHRVIDFNSKQIVAFFPKYKGD